MATLCTSGSTCNLTDFQCDNATHCAFFQRVYLANFPLEERWDFDRLLAFVAEGSRQFYLVEQCGGGESHWVGIVSLAPNGDAFYLEYIAIDAAMAGGGLGSKVLALLFDRFKAIYAEIEPPTNDDRALRRLGFYQRAGWEYHPHVPYIQPAINALSAPIVLHLISIGIPAFAAWWSQHREYHYRQIYRSEPL